MGCRCSVLPNKLPQTDALGKMESAAMNTVMFFCSVVAFISAVGNPVLTVTESMAARVDSQARRVDRITKQFQAIFDKADASIAASKAGGDIARHLMNTHMKGMST